MRAYVDPRTGALRDAPAPGTAPSAMPSGFSRSGQGLAATHAPAAGDGVMVDLQGRFQSPLVARIAPDGKVHIDHGRPGE
jgi:hypothetical protein